jgi:hypothetical protein
MLVEESGNPTRAETDPEYQYKIKDTGMSEGKHNVSNICLHSCLNCLSTMVKLQPSEMLGTKKPVYFRSKIWGVERRSHTKDEHDRIEH